MKRWRALWARRPRLSRGWKIVRNLALTLVLAGLILAWNGPPSPRLAFRQLEGRYLLTPSRVVYATRAASGQYAAYLTEGESWITVGRSTHVSGEILSSDIPVINHVLPKEGLVVAALPAPGEDGSMVVAVWGAPEEAASGSLEVDLIGVDGGVYHGPDKETFSAQARRGEDGWFFFTLPGHDDHPEGEYCAMYLLWDWEILPHTQSVGERPYRLTLFDGQGGEVLSRSGTLPDNLSLL